MTLRVLTLATLFPDASRPRFAPFVERQTLELAAHPEVSLSVIAPIGVPPWPLARHPRYAGLSVQPNVEVWKGLPTRRPRFRHWPGLPHRDPANLAAMVLPLIKGEEIDVIDAEFFWPDGPAAVALGSALGIPVSIKARGSDIAYWGGRMRSQLLAAAAGASGMLAVSAALRAEMIAFGMPGERIRVHYTGVDQAVFAPRDRAATKRLLGVDGPLAVCVANLIDAKGQAVLIEALAALPGWTMVFVGQGPELDSYRAKAELAGVANRARFTGALTQAEAARWMAAADVVALASRSEGLANIWVEALACGTPVVTTDVGGVREVLTEPVFGRIVERSAEAFAGALRDLIANPPDPAAVRAGAARFTWNANTEALYEHLKGVSACSPRSARA